MGIPRRDGGTGTFQVNIRPLVKTCPEEQGIGLLTLPDYTRVTAFALPLWPNHDRGMHQAYRKFLVDTKPDAIFLVGGILNEEAFKQVVGTSDRMRRLVSCGEAVEICNVRERFEGLEDRFLALAALGGEFIADFAEASGGHVYYIPSAPSAGGQVPSELNLFDFVLSQKAKADSWADKHPDEAIEGPPISQDWAEFLGLAGHKHVSIVPFGSAIRINGKLRVDPSDFRRRQPGSASYVNLEQTTESFIQSSDGKVSSWYETKPKHSLGDAHRRYFMGHELGCAFDLKQVGFMRNYDRRGKGILTGTILGERLHGTTIPFLRGRDGRRSFVIDGVAYDEEVPYARARTFVLSLPQKGGDGEAAAPASASKSANAAAVSESQAQPSKAEGKGKVKRTFTAGEKVTYKTVGAGVTSFETDEVSEMRDGKLFTGSFSKDGMEWCSRRETYHVHGMGLTFTVVANDDPQALKYFAAQAKEERPVAAPAAKPEAKSKGKSGKRGSKGKTSAKRTAQSASKRKSAARKK